MGKIKDITNQRYNRLLVLSFSHIDKFKRAIWECLCDCGTIKYLPAISLRRGTTQSCGCLSKAMAASRNRKEKGASGLSYLFKVYKRGAKVRNLCFTLTKEQFLNLTKQNCHYCNVKPNGVAITGNLMLESSKKHSEYIYNGIDRKDNNEGYTIENSLPCCKICNRAKHTMSYEEFKEYLERIKNG